MHLDVNKIGIDRFKLQVFKYLSSQTGFDVVKDVVYFELLYGSKREYVMFHKRAECEWLYKLVESRMSGSSFRAYRNSQPLEPHFLIGDYISDGDRVMVYSIKNTF